jgi:hypothetical protein
MMSTDEVPAATTGGGVVVAAIVVLVVVLVLVVGAVVVGAIPSPHSRGTQERSRIERPRTYPKLATGFDGYWSLAPSA